MGDSSKKVILITGAGSGVGYATAKLLAKRGHTVYGADIRVEGMNALKPFGVIPLKLDMINETTMCSVLDCILSDQKRIDVLINNVRVMFSVMGDLPLDSTQCQFENNFFGLARLTQLVLPHMRSQGSGRIVNTSSVEGEVDTMFGAWYHATKYALEGWSEYLRFELRPSDIQVLLIEPGGVRTRFGAGANKFLQKHYDKFTKAVEETKTTQRFSKGVLGHQEMMFVHKWFGGAFYEWLLRLQTKLYRFPKSNAI